MNNKTERNGMMAGGEIIILGMLILFGALLLFTGCASVNRVAKEMSKQETLIKAGTARYLYEHPARSVQAEKLATRLIELVDAGVLVSAADVKSYILAKMDAANMLPEERELLGELLNEVQKELEHGGAAASDKPEGELKSEMVNVREALEWLRDAAHRYSKRE